MAEQTPGRKKPRIRKTAPTIRERAEAAQAEADAPKNEGIRSGLARSRQTLADSRLRSSKPAAAVGKVLGPLTRLLKKLVPRYFINSWREVRQVTWPSRRETWRLTGAVFIFALVFGVIVAGVDKGLDELFRKVVLK